MPFVFPGEELRKIKKPVLMLMGDQDRLNPPKVLELARSLIPQIETGIIPNADHMLSIKQPELVDRRILKFLEADDQHDEYGTKEGDIHVA